MIFEKINSTNKSLAYLSKREKKKQITKNSSERGDITIKLEIWKLWQYYEQLSAFKPNNLSKIDKFLERQMSKVHSWRNNLNDLVTTCKFILSLKIFLDFCVLVWYKELGSHHSILTNSKKLNSLKNQHQQLYLDP